MTQLTIFPTFKSWQASARRALHLQLPPQEVVWVEATGSQGALELFDEPLATPEAGQFRVPRAFITFAEHVACHRDSGRWALLYRGLWRMLHGETQLLQQTVDADVHQLQLLDREVRRDVHKMRAFVRFREVAQPDGPWFVAWFEPTHHIVELNARFFVERFYAMRWSILTPERCAHWDGAELRFSPGTLRSSAPTEDEMEKLWLTYYSNIFNPARVKIKAMQTEMPKRYWPNLPESSAIPGLLQNSASRVEVMRHASAEQAVGADHYSIAVPPAGAELSQLAMAAKACQACPLWRRATQTVFGEGPLDAKIVVVGEQPGAQEDLAGKPFVGPAGMLLDAALIEAGLERKELYLTNTVKHFKWEPQGKRRLHQTPTARDVAACRPWVEAELERIRPQLIVCLGATASQAILGPTIRIGRDRGQFFSSPFGQVMVTIHPSALLRMRDADKAAGRAQFIADLRLAAAQVPSISS